MTPMAIAIWRMVAGYCWPRAGLLGAHAACGDAQGGEPED
jgi:hypothetical protein